MHMSHLGNLNLISEEKIACVIEAQWSKEFFLFEERYRYSVTSFEDEITNFAEQFFAG